MWTPQHGEKEGELCFINGKCNHFISNNRDFQEEYFRFSRNRERTSRKLGTFWRISPHFVNPLPHRAGSPVDFFFVVDHEACSCVSDRSHTRACAYRAHNEFSIFAFTFTLQFIDFLRIMGEDNAP